METVIQQNMIYFSRNIEIDPSIYMSSHSSTHPFTYLCSSLPSSLPLSPLFPSLPSIFGISDTTKMP